MNDICCDRKTIKLDNVTIRGDRNNISGWCNKIIGDRNTINGNYDHVTGDWNTIHGSFMKVFGDRNKIIGNNNVIQGDWNNATGNNNELKGDRCKAYGKQNKLKGDWCSDTGENSGVIGNEKRGGNMIIQRGIINSNKIVQSVNGYTFMPEPKENCSYSTIINDGNIRSFTTSDDGTNHIHNLTEGNFTATNIIDLNNEYVILGSGGKVSVLNIGDNTFTFKVNKSKLILTAENGTFVNDIKSNVLKRIGDNAIVSNIYFTKNDNYYRCFSDEDFKFIIMKDGVKCKRFKKFPALKVEVPKNKTVLPTQKSETVKKDYPSEMTCKICFENKINTIVIDCKHSCMCSDCAKKEIKKCPICRADIIKGISDMYLS